MEPHPVDYVDETLGQPDKTFEGPSADLPVGSGGTSVMTWKTDGEPSKIGSHPVVLKYSRGEDGAAANIFTFMLNIVEPDTDNDFACPPPHLSSINCMPIVSPELMQYCASDYRAWAQENCNVRYLD